MRDRDPGSPDELWTAFEAEAMPHVDRLFRLAMWWERDRGEAEDLVQDTLVQALQSFHRFTAGTNCRAWLITILQHTRSNRRRAKVRRLALEEPDDRIAETIPFVPPLPQQLTDEDLLAALRGIPEAHQDIILLCDVEELTYKEIAAALEIPLGTVMSRLHRGRAALREQIAATRAGETRASGQSDPATVEESR
jgi:RNA polymerase sigma-70 factor, ECF subfamily